MNVQTFKCNPIDQNRFVEAINKSLSGRMKENWSKYDPNSDSERIREAKQMSEAGKIAYEFLQNLLKKQGKFTSKDYQAYLKYCQELGIDNVQSLAGFNYLKTKIQQGNTAQSVHNELYQRAQAAVDGQKLTVAETAAQPVNTAPISKSLENLLNYVEEQGDKLAETAEVTCHKKYQMVYDTVAMAVSGAVIKNSAIIAGQAGVGKTYSATKVLADRGFKKIKEGNPGPNEYLYNNGSIGGNQESVVWFFYTHRDNEIIVMDDCDSFLTTGNDSINNMLKALLTTGKQGGQVTVGDLRLRRKLSKLMKESTDKNYALSRLIEGTADNRLREQFGDEEFDRAFYDENGEEEEMITPQSSNNENQEGEDKKDSNELKFPSTFAFTSKLICISNLHLNEIDNAVTSRSNCCEIYLTPEEFMVKLNEVKDQLGNDDCRVPLDVYLWHKDVCLEVLNIALECWKTGRKVAGRSIEINSPLEFRIITALADYSIAKTTINGIDVLKMSDNQRTAHIYRMLTENCIDMLAQVK